MRMQVLIMALAAGVVAFAQRDSPSYETREIAFQHANTAQQFQELATVVRVIAELPFVDVMETAGRLRVRGPREQLPTAEWVLSQLDRERPAQAPAASELHTMAPQPRDEDRVRVFHLAHVGSPQALQEAATLVRSLSEARRVMVYNETKALAVRGTEDELKFTKWLLAELDRAPGEASTTGQEYLTRNLRFEYPVRVFVLSSMPPQRLQEVATEVRKKAGAGWLYVYSPLPAIAVRAQAAEMAVAVKALEEAGARIR